MAAKQVGAAAPTYNLPPGTAPGTAPVFQPLQAGQTSGLGLANALMGYQNQANKANNDRYNQGLSVLGNAQNSVNNLYGEAKTDVQNVGTQALNRINLQEQNNLGGMAQSAANRGLGNTTIADTMKALPTMEANDARQGINEMQGKLQSGVATEQAGALQNQGNQIANFVASRTDAGPNAAMFAQLAQASAAGNNGNAPPRQTATIQGGNVFGQSQQPAAPAQINNGQPIGQGGYFSNANKYGAGGLSTSGMGMSGPGIASGGFMSGQGISSPVNLGGGSSDFGGGYDPSMVLPGSSWITPNGGVNGGGTGRTSGSTSVMPATGQAGQAMQDQLAGLSWADLLNFGGNG